METFWSAIFGNDRPVEVEVGSGTGAFILTVATQFPGVNFLGLERSANRVAWVQQALAVHPLPNVRIIAANAACVVSTIIPADSVQTYHIYFPDPWWKRRHHRRRLFTPEFTAALQRTLVPGGRVYVATDVDETFTLMHSQFTASTALIPDVPVEPVRPVTTVFERKGLKRGATIKEAVFVKHSYIDARDPADVRSAAPMTPAESPSWLRRIGVRNSSLNT